MGGSSRSLWIFSAQAERRYARRASTEMLELSREVQREHPELSGRALYRAVIARRLGCDEDKGRFEAKLGKIAKAKRRTEE